MRTILAIGLLVNALTVVPFASAGIDVCVSVECAHTETTTITKTQTCGGSGNVFVTVGDNNTYNVCKQNQTGLDTLGALT